MNKKEAIKLLNHEGWTKADAQRALVLIDFKSNTNIDELMVRRASSKFAGAELLNRQRLQAAQKALVTKRNKEIQEYIAQIEALTLKIGSSSDENSAELEQEVKQLKDKIAKLILVNDDLKKDNKNLKNIVDEIRLKLTVEMKNLLKLKNILDIRKRLVELLKSTLG
ncbi:MAG: hypothetical protein AAF383_21140 [Cyanobacteria bacterium P01_A01_bin.83]